MDPTELVLKVLDTFPFYKSYTNRIGMDSANVRNKYNSRLYISQFISIYLVQRLLRIINYYTI